jgi:anti-anti-sigma factor
MRRIQSLLGEHQPGHLELDMQRVGFMDSSGIALMLNAQKIQKQIGGTLRVTKLSPQVKKVVYSVGLQKMIDIEE